MGQARGAVTVWGGREHAIPSTSPRAITPPLRGKPRRGPRRYPWQVPLSGGVIGLRQVDEMALRPRSPERSGGATAARLC
jgi:hypothetical protein